MIEASFSEVLRVILIILLFYFGFKILLRWFAPLLLKWFLKKVGKQVEKKFGQFDQAQRQRKEEDVQLKKTPGKRKKPNKDAGEYIDYEEIE